MPRYVILRHTLPAESGRHSHWDFMLEFGTSEAGAALRTWAIEQDPTSQQSQPAQLLADHRIAYLTYEGPISGGRGDVVRWDEGTFEVVGPQECRDVAADQIEITVTGRRLQGTVELRRRPDAATDAPNFDYRYFAAATLSATLNVRPET